MSVELIRDIINYEELIGEGSSQTMVNGDILINDRSPEISRVLNMDGKVLILSSEVVEDKIIIEGKMNFDILYASYDENRGIYKTGASTTFTHNIQVAGAMPNMYCKIIPSIEHTEYEVLTNKKVKVNAVINLKGIVYDRKTTEAIVDIKGQDVQLLKNAVEVDECLIGDNAQIVIKGSMDIAEDRPQADSILKTDVNIHKKDIFLQDGKAIINGCAHVRVLYDSNSGNDIYLNEQDLVFTHEIAMAEIKPNMRCDVYFKVEDVNTQIKENENGEKRIIESEVVLGISMKGYLKRELQIIDDAYSSEERYELEKQSLKANSFFGEGSDSQTIKERIVLPSDAEAIAQIKHISAKPIITDVKVFEDKVAIEGIVSCCIMYMMASEEGGMSSYEEEIPFKSVIDIPNIKIDMIPEVYVDVDHISCERISPREIDVKIILESSAKVFYKISVEFVKAVVESEIPESILNMPSIVIYVVQKNDTLWKIAKKYGTTIEDIVKINDLQDADNIMPGMKLLVPKKTFMK
ncbi:DUF3794 domain-containing protein [Caloramator sp. E03]|uniref:DUF3794 and LysM peptidoglycan-binding domain-containing protein n=1 Tax=Caloramator sp. E03 TaxID=2576307 RepID=UPI001110D9AB|nr:SPOCS domain-containing protein [Caloramator sp. E03]QCX33421.1 DUF3794 domain-containing protein [Caloramator sp. E03]